MLSLLKYANNYVKTILNISPQQLQTIYDPLIYENGVPFSLLDSLRKKQAIIWVDEAELDNWPAGNGFWLVLRHTEVSQVLRKPKLFSSHIGATQLRDPATKEDLQYVQQMMLNMDPPEHTRLRRLLQNSFTSTAITKLEDNVRNHARTILDKVIADQKLSNQKLPNPQQGDCDFAKDIAADMPLLSLADILGMPTEDRYLMFDWANRVIGFQDPEYASSSHFDIDQGSDIAKEALKLRPKPDADGNMPDPRSKTGMPDLYRYAHLLAEEKRRNPGDDIMSILLTQVDEEDGVVSIEEFENMFWLFAVAGNETLRNGIPGGMLALLQHPQSLEKLQNDPSLIPSAVDEMLRWWTPVMNFRRTATSDTELAGANIKAGDKVVVSFISANRDETVFDRASMFNIQRSPNPHLTFGYGPHFCLGAQLAKIQMQAIFTETLSRFDEIYLNGKPTYLRSNFQRGVKSLPISWTLT